MPYLMSLISFQSLAVVSVCMACLLVRGSQEKRSARAAVADLATGVRHRRGDEPGKFPGTRSEKVPVVVEVGRLERSVRDIDVDVVQRGRLLAQQVVEVAQHRPDI